MAKTATVLGIMGTMLVTVTSCGHGHKSASCVSRGAGDQGNPLEM